MATKKITTAACVIACVLIALSSVVAQAPRLNGTWTLNLAKSDFGKDTAPKRFTVTVTIDEPRIRLAVDAVTANDEPQNYVLDLTTDGKPVANPQGNASDSAQWDGGTLVLEHNEPQYTLVRRITLSSDGKTATSKDVFKMQSGPDVVVTQVFDRQP
jgi:hypothetical protein